MCFGVVCFAQLGVFASELHNVVSTECMCVLSTVKVSVVYAYVCVQAQATLSVPSASLPALHFALLLYNGHAISKQSQQGQGQSQGPHIDT